MLRRAKIFGNVLVQQQGDLRKMRQTVQPFGRQKRPAPKTALLQSGVLRKGSRDGRERRSKRLRQQNHKRASVSIKKAQMKQTHRPRY